MAVHILIPETCKYVTLYVNTDFADVIKDNEMRRLSWLPGLAQYNPKGP